MFEGPIQTLIEELGRLPGIGPKSAQRLAFHILTTDRADVDRLATALRDVVLASATTAHGLSEHLDDVPGGQLPLPGLGVDRDNE